MNKFEGQFDKNIDSEIPEAGFKIDSKKGGQKNVTVENLKNKDEKVKEMYQEYINRNRAYFEIFAKDTSLSFTMSDGFSINLETGEVNFDTKWFSEHGFTEDQITWAVRHELCHFRDLAEDSDGMMKNFEYIRQQAKKTGQVLEQKYEAKFGQSDPDIIKKIKKQKPVDKKDPSKGTLSPCEVSAYKYHHTFFNIFDDIYVNSLVAKKSPRYARGSAGGNEVSRLYSEKLFKDSDYTKIPRHLQFLYKLLREEMVTSEKVAVSDEVEQILKNKIIFQGKGLTPKELVDNFLKPISKEDTKASTRYFILKTTLEPIFEQLLRKDLEELDVPRPQEVKGEDGESEEDGEPNEDQESGEGDAEPKEGDSDEGSADPFKEYYNKDDLPDILDEKNAPKWVEKEKEKKDAEKKRREEELKSPEQKDKETQEAIDKKWCEENNVSTKEFKEFLKVKEEIKPYLEELSALWRNIIYGKGREVNREKEGFYKTGIELDIPEVINKFPEIEKGNIDVSVMKREVEKEIPVNRPELIRVRLVGDMSGSMGSAEKMDTLRQCFILLLSSLKEFDSYLNISRSETKTKMKVDTEAWIFGDKEEKIKSLRSESNGSSDDTANIVKVLNKLNNPNGGSTMDNTALNAISNSLKPEDLKGIAQKKIMDIIFEITDGGSSDESRTRKSVDNLNETGFITRAFQIGDVGAGETDKFNYVWNNDRENGLGEVVGSEIKNLIPAVVKALKKYLENVKI